MTPLGGSHPSLENVRVCPFLGMPDDAQTALAFPSNWNCCHHCKPAAAIRLEHQRHYCLSPGHKNCPVYLQPAGQALARELRSRSPARRLAGGALWKVFLALFLGALAAGFLLGFGPSVVRFFSLGFPELPERLPLAVHTPAPPPLSPSPGALASPTAARLPVGALPTHLPTLVAGASTPSATPGPQPTATITRIPQGLETLIGLNYIFKIHRVRQGESIQLLAQTNGTTTAALFAVNYQLATPLRPQQVLIIPVNQPDVSDLPPFEPYRLAQDTSLEALAAELAADPTQIQFYNGLGNSDQLYAGEWIVVPREE